MKIVLLGDNNSVHVQKWANALASVQGMQVHVISFGGGKEYNGATYHLMKRFTGTKFDYFLNLARVKKLIRAIEPDILHAHYATSYGFIGACTGFHPFVITGWGADIFDSPSGFAMKKLLQFSFSKADAVTVLSEITKDEISKLTSIRPALIPFGVDTQFFQPKNPARNTDEIIIGTVRTLKEKYGVEYLVKAFLLLEKKLPNLRLHIVGDGELRPLLQALALKSLKNESIVFHGFVSQTKEPERYIKLLQQFDIFVIPSIIDSETFGVAAVEASACAIPVVASRVGGLTEVVSDNETGIIVDPKNEQQLAAAIEKLANNSEMRKTFGARGRQLVLERYNWNENVKTMKELYKNLISRYKGKA